MMEDERLGAASPCSFCARVTCDGVEQGAGEALSPPRHEEHVVGAVRPAGGSVGRIGVEVCSCASADGESFWVVVPPRTSSVALVRRSRGGCGVRVSRDGALASAKYEELSSFHNFVLGIVPGILTMGGARGALAHTVKLLATGDDATVSVATTTSTTDQARPAFVVACGSDEMIGPTDDFAEVLSELSVPTLFNENPAKSSKGSNGAKGKVTIVRSTRSSFE